jgi:hypothetical protein
MRLRPSRRDLIVAGALATAAAAIAVSFAPVVRGIVARAAALRHAEVTVGTVRPGWFAVRLLDLQVRPLGASSIRVHVDEVRLGLSGWLRLSRVDARGAAVELTGSPEAIRDDWRRFRGERRETSEGNGHGTPIDAAGVSVRWVDPDAPNRGAELRGIAFSRDAVGVRLLVTDGQLRFGRAGIDLGQATAQTGADGRLIRAHVGPLTVGWIANVDATPTAVAPPPPIARTSPPLLLAHATRSGRRPQPSAEPPDDAGAPLVPLPDLHAMRAGAAALVAALAERIQPGADIGVDSLTWKITQGADRVALTFGPGPLTFARTAGQLELGYSTGRHDGSTPLALRIVLPNDRGDLVMTAEGGPVSLALLGLKEGAAGLVDVDMATVAGRARAALAGDGSAVTFDGEAAMHGISLNQPRLASEAVRGLDLALRARGTVTAPGEVRVDDFAATLGALRITGSGILDQRPDHVAGAARFEVPLTGCQPLIDSIPAALLPDLKGTKMDGTFAAHGRFAFDTRSLDELELSYDTRDECRVGDVPAALDHDRFTQPFAHRIYLPDGSIVEETTGPGTPIWTSLDQISPYMQIAVLTTEDGAFPKHHGYNHAAIRAALIANLKARRFVRGASTITMQLAKNLFLSRDKTLSRKLEEVVLTDYLEQTFSKDEIMELYLNVIEFGPAVYGITSAAEFYFGRTPAELDLAECLFLSTLLPAPLRYSAMREGDQPSEGWLRTLHSLMEVERKRGLITDAELSEGESEPVLFWHGGPRPEPRTAVHARTPAAGADTEIIDPFDDP